MISVVIPAYNCRQTIDRALRSVESQTLPASEVVVVDDGSTDGTADLLDGWQRSGRIRLVRQTNGGPSPARNRGVREARGPWIAFLDADDEFVPEALAEARGMLAQQPAARWLMCDIIRLRPSRKEHLVCDVPPGEVSRWLPAILEKNFVERGHLFDRETLLAAGGYEESLRCFEDWELYIRLIQAGIPVVHIPRPLYHYIETTDSLTRNIPLMVASLAEVLRRHHRRLAGQGDPVFRRIYARWMWRLAREYHYKLHRRGAALGCLAQSLRFDLDLRRFVHAIASRFE